MNMCPGIIQNMKFKGSVRWLKLKDSLHKGDRNDMKVFDVPTAEELTQTP
jgi:hypothetical protein